MGSIERHKRVYAYVHVRCIPPDPLPGLFISLSAVVRVPPGLQVSGRHRTSVKKANRLPALYQALYERLKNCPGCPRSGRSSSTFNLSRSLSLILTYARVGYKGRRYHSVIPPLGCERLRGFHASQENAEQTLFPFSIRHCTRS